MAAAGTDAHEQDAGSDTCLTSVLILIDDLL